MTTWTKELPKESGFYWTRSMFLEGSVEVVEFAVESGIVTCCGDEIGLGGYWSSDPEGEWWPERILPPDELRATWSVSAQAPKDIILYASALPPIKVELDPNHPHA
jgi:hypothetical protein